MSRHLNRAGTVLLIVAMVIFVVLPAFHYTTHRTEQIKGESGESLYYQNGTLAYHTVESGTYLTTAGIYALCVAAVTLMFGMSLIMIDVYRRPSLMRQGRTVEISEGEEE